MLGGPLASVADSARPRLRESLDKLWEWSPPKPRAHQAWWALEISALEVIAGAQAREIENDVDSWWRRFAEEQRDVVLKPSIITRR